MKNQLLSFPVGCRFPFLYRGLWHEKCVKLHPADSSAFEIRQLDNGIRYFIHMIRALCFNLKLLSSLLSSKLSFRSENVFICSVTRDLTPKSVLICPSMEFFSPWIKLSKVSCLAGYDFEITHKPGFQDI